MSRSRRALSRKWRVLEVRAEKAEALAADRLKLLRRMSDWFKANYSYVYEDEEAMKLWKEIDEELADA